MVDAVQMSTTVEEWGARFRLHIVERLTTPGKQTGLVWDRDEALRCANIEWDALKEDFNSEFSYGIDDDPKEAADDLMCEWTDDGE
jgi:hypothetical protein